MVDDIVAASDGAAAVDIGPEMNNNPNPHNLDYCFVDVVVVPILAIALFFNLVRPLFRGFVVHFWLLYNEEEVDYGLSSCRVVGLGCVGWYYCCVGPKRVSCELETFKERTVCCCVD